MSSPFRALQPGDPAELGGHTLLARLGSGGMGRVYLARMRSGRPLAVKVIRAEYAEDTEFRRRFRQEVGTAHRVRGRFLAALIDADLDSASPWLATEYVPGPSLADAVAGYGPLPEPTVRTLLAGATEALQAVHRAGVVHRDLKPSNLLLGPDGPCVIDFGIARAADATPLTGSGEPLGTPQFMAPEQARGEVATPASDVWSLGALAWFAAVGRRPFGEGPPSATLYRIVHEPVPLSDCPAYLRPILARCLAKDPAQRPDLDEVLAACGEGATGRRAWVPESIARTIAQYEQTPSLPVYDGRPAAPPLGPSDYTLAAPLTHAQPHAQITPSFPAPGTPPPPARTASGRRRWLLAGAAVVVLAGVGVGAAVLASGDSGGGTPDGGHAAPGTYPVNRPVTEAAGWKLTLTDLRVAADGTLTADVDYVNGAGAEPLVCATSADPGASELQLSDGTVLTSTSTFCSQHPTGVLVPTGTDPVHSFATFPPVPAGASFTLRWQPGQSITGTLDGLHVK